MTWQQVAGVPGDVHNYVGLMSGTSMDGIDAVLVSFEQNGGLKIVGSATTAYPAALRDELICAIAPDRRLSIHEMATLDIRVGRCFGEAVRALLQSTGLTPADISGLGSHGQTIRHSPLSEPPYSVQIGDPATIATLTKIITVADFRSMDIARGGEGAPLVPAFHDWFFRDAGETRVILNIGGIANITLLPAAAEAPIQGFDTGPGNCLLDEWSRRHLRQPYDKDGHWAIGGNASARLLAALLSDMYFARSQPKSTGREHFNIGYVERHLSDPEMPALSPRDVQATLAQLTVESIALSIETLSAPPARIVVAGGGTKNPVLMAALAARLSQIALTSSDAYGLDPEMLEAVAFAWLAKRRLDAEPVSLPTGPDRRGCLLGAIYDPTPARLT